MITANLYPFKYRNFRFRGNAPFIPQPMYRGERPINYRTNEDWEAMKASIEAKSFGNIGDWTKSIEANKKQLSACEEKDYIHKASIYASMAKAYSEMGQEDKALLCFYEATKFYGKVVSDYDEAVKNYRAPAHTPPKSIEKYTESLAYNAMNVGRLLMSPRIPQNTKKKIHKGNDPIFYFKKAYNHLGDIRETMDKDKNRESRNYCITKIINCCHKKQNGQNNKEIGKTVDRWASKFEK